MAEAIVRGGRGPREVLLVELAGESSRLHGHLLRELGRAGVRARWHGSLEGPGSRPATLSVLLRHLAGVCASAVDGGELPLLLSPDQTATASAWQGVARAREAHGRIGLILIDARLDAATPDDGPAIADEHQLLPRLLGECAAAEDTPFPFLDPGCVCVVAARDWSAAEVERVSRLGVRVFGLSEVRRRGFAATFCDALSIARSAAGGFVVSLDLSALDALALAPEPLATALYALRECPDLLAFEIARAQRAPDWSAEFAVAALGPPAQVLRAHIICSPLISLVISATALL